MIAPALCARAATGTTPTENAARAVAAKYVSFVIVIPYPAELMPFLLGLAE
jgi:hypothetical protein